MIIWYSLFLDISRAVSQSHQNRDVYTERLKARPASAGHTECETWIMTLYGCLDAGRHIDLLVFDICSACGAEGGATNSCVHHHGQEMLSFLHDGDDFVIFGRMSETQGLKGIIGSRLIVKDRGSLGPRDSDLKEMGILHLTAKWCGPEDFNGERVTYSSHKRC